MRASSFQLYGLILLVLILGAVLGSLSYSDKISSTLQSLESRTSSTLTVNEPASVVIPQEIYWALDDLWKATEQTQRIINENRFQIYTYYYQIYDLTTRLQAVEEELNSLLSDRKWN